VFVPFPFAPVDFSRDENCLQIFEKFPSHRRRTTMPRLPINKSRIPIKRITWRPPAYPKVPSGVPSFAAKPHTTYKLRNKILAGGKNILFGNNVSEFKNHTRRIWRPNIKVKSLWSEALGRRVRLRLVTSVMRTIDKVGGLDAYLTCTTKARMKELGPRGWEIRAAVLKSLAQQERAKYIRLFQRSILLCPKLNLDTTWKEIRPLIRHTEGYAVLPEQYCKKAFGEIMERLREGRSVTRRRRVARTSKPRTIVLSNRDARRLVRRTRLMNMPAHIKLDRRRKALLQSSPKSARAKPAPIENVERPQSKLTADQAMLNNWKTEWKKMAKKEAKRKKHLEYRATVKQQAIEAVVRNKQLRKAWLS